MNNIKTLSKFFNRKEIIKLNNIINKNREDSTFEIKLHLSISNNIKGIYEDKKLIAFICMSNSHINNIGCDPNYQNKGVASLLLKQAQLDFNSLTLEVDPNNKKAIHLYEKYGFYKKQMTSKNYILMEWKRI